MLIIPLLALLSLTPCAAHVVGRQVLIDECEDGHVVAPAISAISNACGTATASRLTSSLTSQSFPSSNPTTITHNHTTSHNQTTATNRLTFSSNDGIPSSTQSSLSSSDSRFLSSTRISSPYQTSVESDSSSILSSFSSQNSQFISSYNSRTGSDRYLVNTTLSLNSSPIKDSPTPSTSTTAHNEAFRQSPTSSESPLSMSVRSSQSSIPASATLSVTTKFIDVFSQPVPVGSNRTTLSSTSLKITSTLRSMPSFSTSGVKGPLSNSANRTTPQTSITPPPSVTKSNQSITATEMGDWPATITFCSETNGKPVIGYAFVTAYSGATGATSSVTNIIPSQALISSPISSACAGEVAVTNNGLVTTIELSTLPSATSLSQLTALPGVLVVTIGGRPVIEHVPCGDIGIGLGFFVHLFLHGCSGHTGFLGWPGGPILGGFPPPFPGEAPGEGPGGNGDDPKDSPTASDEWTMTKTESREQSSAASSTQSSESSTQSSASSTQSSASSTQASASKVEYFIIASPNADQIEIQAKLKLFDPAKGGTYEPDVGDTSVSGGTWVDYQLDSDQSSIIASRRDIILVMKSTAVSGFETASGATTIFTNVPSAVSFVTVSPESKATSLGLVSLRDRQDRRNLVRDDQAVITSIRTRGSHKAEATMASGARNGHFNRFRQRMDLTAVKGLAKRDPGTSLVRQVRQNLGGLAGDKYPKDLAVYSWAPKVASVSAGKVDYIFEQTRGESTWVYLVDTGVAKDNLV